MVETCRKLGKPSWGAGRAAAWLAGVKDLHGEASPHVQIPREAEHKALLSGSVCQDAAALSTSLGRSGTEPSSGPVEPRGTAGLPLPSPPAALSNA